MYSFMTFNLWSYSTLAVMVRFTSSATRMCAAITLLSQNSCAWSNWFFYLSITFSSPCLLQYWFLPQISCFKSETARFSVSKSIYKFLMIASLRSFSSPNSTHSSVFFSSLLAVSSESTLNRLRSAVVLVRVCLRVVICLIQSFYLLLQSSIFRERSRLTRQKQAILSRSSCSLGLEVASNFCKPSICSS